jgi:actin-binding LIM protein
MCFACKKFVEGEVVTALGKTYHQQCFRCAGCDKTFPTGERVTFTGKSCLCTACAKSTVNNLAATSPRQVTLLKQIFAPM